MATDAVAVSARPRARSDLYTPEFESWWRVYPRHDGKLAAARAYRGRREAGRSATVLVAAAWAFAAHQQATPTDKIPHGATWLNGRRDEEWEHGAPDAERSRALAGAVAPAASRPSNLAISAASLRAVEAAYARATEENGDRKPSFWAAATADDRLPDPAARAADRRALPGSPQGSALA